MSTSLNDLNPGDIVYAATNITNDGSHPEVADSEIIAPRGTRGVLVNIGHLEEDPEKELMLVRFESSDLTLGPPVGCWVDELVAEQPQDS